MAKKKKTTKPDPAQVPCMRVVVGGKPGATGAVDSAACRVVGESRGSSAKFDLGRKYKATSKSVTTPKKNKPCMNALKRQGCPVQLGFDKGQPFLRFCEVNGQAGPTVDVNSPAEAVAAANAACATWKATGKFALPEGAALKGRGARTR